MNSPVCSVIITHHLDYNQEYLKLCVKSYLSSVGLDFEVIVVSDAKTCPSVYLPQDPRLHVYHHQEMDSFKKKVDQGIKNMHPQSKFIFLSNDDIMVNKHALALMVEWSHNTGCIVNGFCNSDNKATWLGNMTIDTPAGHIALENSLSIADLKGQEDFLINLPPIPGQRVLWFREWVPMYATCISRFVWDMVGKFDEELDVYGNDWDWCMRANDLKYRCAVDPTALVIHFHHKTLGVTANTESIEKAKQHLVEKRKKVMGVG